MRSIATVAAIIALAPALAFAQGSTGGTLGKTDQSLSGGQPKEMPAEKASPQKKTKPGPDVRQSGCGRNVDVWAWSNGLEVVVRPDATAVVSNGVAGILTCAGGTYVFKWQGFGHEAHTFRRRKTDVGDRSSRG
jgi:hypothetical protein